MVAAAHTGLGRGEESRQRWNNMIHFANGVWRVRIGSQGRSTYIRGCRLLEERKKDLKDECNDDASVEEPEGGGPFRDLVTLERSSDPPTANTSSIQRRYNSHTPRAIAPVANTNVGPVAALFAATDWTRFASPLIYHISQPTCVASDGLWLAIA